MEMTIRAEKLSKAYGEIRALEEVDILVNRGTVYGLLGANGAGKSTAIECILGTRRADSGTVSVLGFDPVKDRKILFQRVGVQFQESSYQDKITVGELCLVTKSLYKRPADENALLKQFGLSDKRKSLISELSGGLKQRLFIVLALIPGPEVVFLDELTTGLDAKARREVWKYLTELKGKGMTILMTSHFMDEVEAMCDTINILKKGKSVFCGTVKDAIASSPFDQFEDAYLWYTDDPDICVEEEYER
jgi:ABC-2 type transport system ATP-binding protein